MADGIATVGDSGRDSAGCHARGVFGEASLSGTIVNGARETSLALQARRFRLGGRRREGVSAAFFCEAAAARLAANPGGSSGSVLLIGVAGITGPEAERAAAALLLLRSVSALASELMLRRLISTSTSRFVFGMTIGTPGNPFVRLNVGGG